LFSFMNLTNIELSYKVKKDSYHDLCHNKSLAISFATGISRYRLSVTKPPLSRRSATPFFA
ncbi:hypothetical protein LIQ95_07815, partial [[Ruminococcus] gnavus]|uniref:hypothetical protein n=1 Tax=Mediterraneibacter gnavus TaxID=33038 RepID=UPI001D052101